MLPVINTGMVLSVVFDMVTKPASIPVALGVIAIGTAPSAGSALRRPKPAGPHNLALVRAEDTLAARSEAS